MKRNFESIAGAYLDSMIQIYHPEIRGYISYSALISEQYYREVRESFAYAFYFQPSRGNK